MRVTLGWLKSYVDFALSARETAEALTMAGLEVEGVSSPGPLLAGMSTAKVLSVKRHPDADALWVCEVDAGDGVVPVVCGAPNTRADLVTAYVPPGVTLPGGMTVKEAKIRGQVSRGMLCSVRELGIGDDHSGIWELPPDLKPGEDLAAATFLDDFVLEIGVTANRGDCLSAIGVARDLAAILGTRIRPPKYRPQKVGGKIDEQIKVDIRAPELCRRYAGMMVRDVTIGPSPLWMASRLRLVGVRPINNIVDVTNYVLMDWGQPLHAFDYDKLFSRAIVVRRARDGEQTKTLDGALRTLSADTLLICDGESPVAVAGVMGGLESEVAATTRAIFIESAYFDPQNVRRTSAALGLATESSYRFERGVDPEGVVHALHCAAYLMEELGGGKIVSGMIDNHPRPVGKSEIRFRVSRASAVLGVPVTHQRANEILLSLGMEVQPIQEGVFRVTAPSWRADVTREIDLIEEIARIDGYAKIPLTLPRVSIHAQPRDPSQAFGADLRERMTALGFQEVINVGLENPARLAPFLADGEALVRLVNPPGEDGAAMRSTLLPGLLRNLKHNTNFGTSDVRVFEIRPVFSPAEGGGLPPQRLRVAALATGLVRPVAWNQPAEVADFFHIKGVVEALCAGLGIAGVEFALRTATWLHPGQCAALVHGDRTIGLLGTLHPDLARSLDLSGEPVVFELDIEALHKLSKSQTKYAKESRFPPVLRDLAVVVDEATEAGRVYSAIMDAGFELLRDARLFDVYRGPGVETGKKSLAFSLRYQAMDRSLTDADVAAVHDAVVRRLGEKVGARLRG
jgi:phenylalanyl-tRNA synthetase beta chain